MEAWPAQPALTPRETFSNLTRLHALTLTRIADTLETSAVRKIAAREELRRELAGIVAHCENLRLALAKGCA